jgi:DMSO/TMAO reductase YedYZ heme-binding membrane subunit
VVTLVLDKTAKIEALDAFLPFQVSYGQLAIGLGTISLDIFVIVTLTSWLRRRMNDRLWRWIHRASYAAFLALFLHAFWAGTDFDAPLISAVSWSAALGIGLLSISRMLFGRLPE